MNNTKTPAKTPKNKKRLRLGCLIAGLIFLANPSINLFDILPDFIGYALILFAIGPAADSAPYFSDAKDRFLKLFWVGASKIPALLLMMAIYAGDMSQRSIIAVFALVYATVELLYLIPAFRFLFEGFYYLGERHDCAVALSRGKRLDPDRLPSLVILFFAVRAAASCLPEFTLVPYGEEGEAQRFAALCLRAYPFLALLGVLTVIVFGVTLLRPIFAYLRRLDSDGSAEQIVRRLEGERKLELARKQDYRAIRSATVWLIVGAGLGMDPILDSINFVPDVLSGLAFTAALIILGQRIPRLRMGIRLMGAYSAISLAAFILSNSFYASYTLDDLYHQSAEAEKAYSLYLGVAFAELIASALVGAFLAYTLIRMIPFVSDSFGETDSLQSVRLRCSMRREAIFVGVLHFISAAATFANAFLAQYTKSIRLEPGEGASALPHATSSTVPLVDGFWIVPLLLAAAELIAVLHLTSRFRTESELTYSDIL